MQRTYLIHPGAQRSDHTPASQARAESHHRRAKHDHPGWHLKCREITTDNKAQHNHTHCLLSIICTVTQSKSNRRKELCVLEKIIDVRGRASCEVVDQSSDQKTN